MPSSRFRENDIIMWQSIGRTSSSLSSTLQMPHIPINIALVVTLNSFEKLLAPTVQYLKFYVIFKIHINRSFCCLFF